MFTIHLASHRDKKALISLRQNGKDVASIIGQASYRNNNTFFIKHFPHIIPSGTSEHLIMLKILPCIGRLGFSFNNGFDLFSGPWL